jgi:hypothetical protein
MQSRIDSLMEALTNTAIGLAISQVANMVILPLVLGVPVSMGAAFVVGFAFTVISVGRQYTLRRLFDGKTVWQALKHWATRPRYVW